MRTHLWKFLLVLLLVVLFANAVYPPGQKLKLGKDLAGGVTILYGIKPDAKTGRQPSTAQVTQMISVIRDRIDPKGVYDISIEALGTNQIEISMPLPSAEVKAARLKLDAQLNAMVASAIDPDELDEVFRLTGADREARIAALSQAVPERQALFEAAILAHDRMRTLEAQFTPLEREAREAQKIVDAPAAEALAAESEAIQAVSASGVQGVVLSDLVRIEDPAELQKRLDELAAATPDAPAATAALKTYVDAAKHRKELQEEADRVKAVWRLRLEPLGRAAAEATTAFDEAREKILNTSINVEEVRRVLGLDHSPRSIRDAASGKDIPGPSVRDEAIARLKSRFPVLADQIDQTVVLYDEYRGRARGYDDPKDLIALLRGAGVLSFRITAVASDPLPLTQLREELRARGPSGIRESESARWFPVDNPEGWANDERERNFLHTDPAGFFSARGYIAEEFDGVVYLLLYTTPDRALSETSGPWKLTGATHSLDRQGRPAVSFRLDVSGARLLPNSRA